MENQKKYKIDEEMRKLNHVSYKAALKIIPKRLKIASNTFHNYRKLLLNDKADIPYGLVRKLECIFGLNMGELANYSVDCKSLDILIKEPLHDSDTMK
ncbi:hypothetical protein [Pedobacter frigoris]|uniref:Helix-turn-helix transcriptional regulator n=1 Tax=Pedobacter frigoris TaxID=2571272 RepID=A0A4U1CD77_9SPHI|nr:hypothetical protein [Pedobacter frigoris]TKC04908.1 hypothetical protein FA047_14145 [Pedobacter frigoris]